MPKVQLTSGFVRAAGCPTGRPKIDFFDLSQRGLMLEVRASGGKTYYQRYTDDHGRERQFKIGPADVITLEQARRQARTVHAHAVLGDDPQARRRELRATPTIAAFVAERYLPYVKTYKRSWQTDETMLRIHVLPAIGSLAADEVTTEAVSALLEGMRADGYSSGTTNRALVLVRYLYNLGRKWKVPGMKDNPTLGLSTAPDVQRDRFLTAEETQRLIVAIEADENRTAARAILLLLLTGGRRNEITQAKWEYVNWQKRTLLVPLSKSGKPRAIALNAQALELLRSIPRLEGNPYIFPSEITGRPSPSLYFPWDRIRERAALYSVRLHDLRHSFASFLVNQGISLYVVQGLLGHSHARTTQRYAHLAQETLLDAAQLVGAIVSGTSQPGAGANESRVNLDHTEEAAPNV